MFKKITTEEFIKNAKEKHGNKYIYYLSIYLGVNKNIIIICPIHGSFHQTPHCHLAGSGCKTCGFEKRSIDQASNTEEFIQKAKLKHGNKYNYDKVDYKNNYSKITIICIIHGNFLQIPANHLSHKNGCPSCSGNQKSNTEEFIQRAKLKHDDKYNYDKFIYLNKRTKGIITCFVHGIFNQTPNSHLNDESGCPNCINTISKSETRWLDSLNVIVRQKTIKINGKNYRVDGFDPVTNTIYEFNGDYWHGNPKFYKTEDVHPISKKTYGELYRLTLQKEQDLKDAGYNIISIWESDFNSIQ